MSVMIMISRDMKADTIRASLAPRPAFARGYAGLCRRMSTISNRGSRNYILRHCALWIDGLRDEEQRLGYLSGGCFSG